MFDDDEEFKAWKAVVYATVAKVFGALPEGQAIFQKEFEAQIKDVTQPQGGTENLTNVRSPGQPPAKIPAEPGESGSSGVYRTVTGKAATIPEKDALDADAKSNPEGTVETKQNVPSALYPDGTHITTGGGYQMEVLRGMNPESTFRGRRFEPSEHSTYKSYMGIQDAEKKVNDARLARQTLPILKHLQASNAISPEELQKLEKEGKLVDTLVQKTPETKGKTFMMKHLERVYSNGSSQ